MMKKNVEKSLLRKNEKIIFSTLVMTLLISTVLLSGCVQEELVLDGVEIRDYQGEKLSSVNDFRENSIKGPQYVDKNNYSLKITGLVETPKSYSYEEVINKFTNYKKVITLYCVEGWDTKILWEGVLVSDIIKESNPLSEVDIIIFHAYDGYTTSLSLDYIEDNNIMIAYKMNNVTLPPERGFPFQLVAESKWGYKWIKWITDIELSDDTDYKGFWERRGYSNKGNLNESFFD
jgi:DMSO/TMAO reductase YedYZ molybdopterin-dependent catalytic subunit